MALTRRDLFKRLTTGAVAASAVALLPSRREAAPPQTLPRDFYVQHTYDRGAECQFTTTPQNRPAIGSSVSFQHGHDRLFDGVVVETVETPDAVRVTAVEHRLFRDWYKG